MATCIHSSRSCVLPFYTIPIFPLLNRKIFHLLVITKYGYIGMTMVSPHYNSTFGKSQFQFQYVVNLRSSELNSHQKTCDKKNLLC